MQNCSVQGIFIRKENYPELWEKSVTQVGDYFNCMNGPRTILQLDDLNEKYGVILNLLSYLRLKTTIEKAAKIKIL